MKIYKKIIRPMILDGRNMISTPFEDYWYDDEYFNREIVGERFHEKNDDPWVSLKWDEKYVECGEIKYQNMVNIKDEAKKMFTVELKKEVWE